MNTLRRYLRLLCALAVGLVAAAAVLPAAAQVMAARNGADANLHLVCSAQGTRWVDNNGHSVQPAAAAAATLGGWFDHCPLCQVGHAGTLPLPQPPQGLPPAPRHAWLPAAWLQAPHTPHAWLTASPRAPPHLG